MGQKESLMLQSVPYVYIYKKRQWCHTPNICVAVAQSVECATPGEEVMGSIPADTEVIVYPLCLCVAAHKFVRFQSLGPSAI